MRPYTCSRAGCAKTFATPKALAQHHRYHNALEQRIYSCTHTGCDKAFATRQKLDAHTRTHTGERPYKCTVDGCNETFTQSAHLTSHVRTHTGEKPYTCDHPGCDAAFATSGALVIHKRTHTGEKPYKCPAPGCSAAFACSGTLVMHKRVHTGERPYACTEAGCTAQFAQQSGLRAHVSSVHRGEKPFACQHPSCGARFATRQKQSMHMVVHTGARPYSCPRQGCIATFAWQGNLTLHLMGHDGDLPHLCFWPDCEAAFKTAQALTKHTRMHTQERPYSCSECGSAFRKNETLQQHIATRHSTEGRARRKLEEERIETLLTKAGIDFTREHHISFGCWKGTWASADFLLLHKGGILVIEVDERQHKHESPLREMSRMRKMHHAMEQGGNTLPLSILRYNPNAFQVNGITRRIPKKDREAKLLETIGSWQHGPAGSLSIQHMFYSCCVSGDRPRLCIWDDADLDDIVECCSLLKKCSRVPVICM